MNDELLPTARQLTNAELLRALTLAQRRRGLAPNTIDNRRRFLRRFAGWLGAKGLLAADEDDINLFLDSRKVAAASRAGYVTHLKVFYSWAVRTGHLDRDPTIMVDRPKVAPGLPRPIHDHDLEVALEMSGGQHRVMLCAAAFEGLRCCEIAALTREDIFDDRNPPVLVARGKGGKHRIIPLHNELWKALQFLPPPRSGPVLRGPDGHGYTAWQISQMGNAFLHGMGIDATMHQLRHWFASEVYQASGGDLLLTQDLLGHASPDTTRVYAAFDRAGATEAVRSLAVRRGRPSPRGGTVRAVRRARARAGPRGVSGQDAIRQEGPAGAGRAENGGAVDRRIPGAGC